MSLPPPIDCHAHQVPARLFRGPPEAAIASIDDPGGRPVVRWQGGGATQPMHPGLGDGAGFERWLAGAGFADALLSVWPDLVGSGLSPEAAAVWGDWANGVLAEEWAGRPALGIATLQAPEAAARQVRAAVAAGLAGVLVPTAIGARPLTDPGLAPFWRAASESGAVVFVHPVRDGPVPMPDPALVNTLARPLQTTIAGTCLVLDGLPRRYPGARILLAHGGGALPYLLGRLANHRRQHGGAHDPEQELRALWFDSVLSDPRALRLLVEVVGDGQVLPGSDHPYGLGDPAPLATLAAAFAPDRAARIAAGTAAFLGWTADHPSPQGLAEGPA